MIQHVVVHLHLVTVTVDTFKKMGSSQIFSHKLLSAVMLSTVVSTMINLSVTVFP